MNPARVACEGFSTDTRKALTIQCYTHVGVRAELNQLIFSTHEVKSNKHFEEYFLNDFERIMQYLVKYLIK